MLVDQFSRMIRHGAMFDLSHVEGAAAQSCDD
jgi:hypothetical protein